MGQPESPVSHISIVTPQKAPREFHWLCRLRWIPFRLGVLVPALKEREGGEVKKRVVCCASRLQVALRRFRDWNVRLCYHSRRANHQQVASSYQGKLGITNITSAVAAAVLTMTALEALNKQRRFVENVPKTQGTGRVRKSQNQLCSNDAASTASDFATTASTQRAKKALSLLRSKVLQLV